MARWWVNLAYSLAAIVYLPVLWYQMVVQGKNRRGWRQRFGFIHFIPHSVPRIWVHAVSLGEVNATPQIVARLRDRFPDREIVISSTTDTGYARACEFYGRDNVFRFPLDFSWVVRRVLDRLGAEVLILVELEVWYNLVRMATGRGIGVAVINGRLTAHSARRLARLGSISREMFGELAWVGAQDAEIAERFVRLGALRERVSITGSLKWDSATVADDVEGSDRLANALGIDRRRALWVCGSTGPGEEKLVLDAYRMLQDRGVSMSLLIVPRKPERFDEVARLIEQKGYRCVRRSRMADGNCGDFGAVASAVFLGDTVGELRKFYSLADVVFVGRSLVPMGGSDPMEVAALGKAMIAGPWMDNFKEPVTVLRSFGALWTVADAAELGECVRRLAEQPETVREAGRSARECVLRHQGATQKTFEALTELISSGAAACS